MLQYIALSDPHMISNVDIGFTASTTEHMVRDDPPS